MNKKVFISVPMHDRDDIHDVFAEIKIIEELVKKHFDDPGILCVNNAAVLAPPSKSENEVERRLFCLGKAIETLGECDALILGRDWDIAKGCCVEAYVAHKYGIDTYIAHSGDLYPCILNW